MDPTHIDPSVVERNQREAADCIARVGFTADLGIELMRLKPGMCEARLRLSERHLNTMGIVHGGVLYSLADTVASLAAASYGEGGSTVQGSINYMRAAKLPEVTCRAEVTKYGKHLIWSEAEIIGSDGKVCCHCEFIHYQMHGASNFGIEPVFRPEVFAGADSSQNQE